MQIAKERIKYLFLVYTEGIATETEEEELFRWFDSLQDGAVLHDYIQQIVQEEVSGDEEFSDVEWEKIYGRIMDRVHFPDHDKTELRGGKRLKWYWAAAAIFLVLLLSSGVYTLLNKERSSVPQMASVLPSAYQNDVKPGGVKAILRAGAVQVKLNKVDTSFLLGGNPVHIAGGQLKIAKVKAKQYTLITPRGATYQVKLADGTIVWLNADSRLTYPSVFSGASREVILEGEAYFDVQDDPGHPFIVHSAGQRIQVLGTAFNIEAYRNEQNIVTTLVQGKIKVGVLGDSVLLEPGQQAQWDKSNTLQVNPDADVAQAIAWKNGYFRFHRANLKTIMRRLARWYDVDVSYDKGLKPHYFGILISRNNDLSQILEMLEATNEVHFKVEGRKVMVIP